MRTEGKSEEIAAPCVDRSLRFAVTLAMLTPLAWALLLLIQDLRARPTGRTPISEATDLTLSAEGA